MSPNASSTAIPARSVPVRKVGFRVYRGKSLRPEYDLTALEREARVPMRQAAFERLRELYNQGVPFFSKDVFRHVVAQLDHCRANPRAPDDAQPHVISIPAIDGTTVELELETGELMYREVDIDFIVGDPYLDYRPLQHLTRTDDIYNFLPHMTYCPTSLMYPLKSRHIQTNEFLPPSNRAPLEDVQTVFDTGLKAWTASDDCKRLASFLDTTPLPKITKIVAFACGSMALAEYPDAQARSAHQHALILTLRDIILARQHHHHDHHNTADHPRKIQCFVQDPVYSEADEQVLQKVGVTVLPDPRGFLEVDDETVVLSFCPNIPVRQVVADIARPAVMIWDHVMSEAEAEAFWSKRMPGHDYIGHSCDPESSRLRDMVREHYLAPVALGPETMFSGASVYVRKD